MGSISGSIHGRFRFSFYLRSSFVGRIKMPRYIAVIASIESTRSAICRISFLPIGTRLLQKSSTYRPIPSQPATAIRAPSTLHYSPSVFNDDDDARCEVYMPLRVSFFPGDCPMRAPMFICYLFPLVKAARARIKCYLASVASVPICHP